MLYMWSCGVHTWQRMYGCELSDEGIPSGYDQHGYDGEDFISFDLKSLTWIAANQKAEITKRKWDPDAAYNQRKKNYLVNICIEWLKKYVGYGRATLERKVPPKTDLFQKDPSSPVVCHATGFFPKAVTISWKKNGEDVHENVELRETLPNPDGTFQKRSVLTVPPEELKGKEYTCVIQHVGMKEELRLSDPRVLSGGGSIGIIICAVVAVLLVLVIACIGVFIWRKKKSGNR
ncbi:hypothetical protein NFI96_026615 [Prochilodus magdalenae]|nr:hypothetical protein NFI96_026615 [Prochilodus magdalenae]